MTWIRCYKCRTMFPKNQRACPECDTPIRGTNMGLVAGKWSAALNAQAQRAVETG